MAALMIAIKMHDDQIHQQSYYAKIAGLKPKALSKLEIAFLENLNY